MGCLLVSLMRYLPTFSGGGLTPFGTSGNTVTATSSDNTIKAGILLHRFAMRAPSFVRHSPVFGKARRKNKATESLDLETHQSNLTTYEYARRTPRISEWISELTPRPTVNSKELPTTLILLSSRFDVKAALTSEGSGATGVRHCHALTAPIPEPEVIAQRRSTSYILC